MGKGDVLFAAVLVTVGLVGVAAVRAARWVSRWVWVLAETRARWEPHTDEAANSATAGGTPVAVVTIELVAWSFGRRRVVKTRPIGWCTVHYPGDPDLLELQARAGNQAAIRNTSLRGGN